MQDLIYNNKNSLCENITYRNFAINMVDNLKVDHIVDVSEKVMVLQNSK